ncbi:ComF family protein [Streptomyces sp. GD-15H]|uniref:ComF family protein n=1 Tax=Streptomyces sp. GD-15H TaxID=3129112 RepID=UPI003243872D
MRGWWQDLTDLVLPAECGGCGRPRAVLCERCRTALSGAAPRRVRPVPRPAGLPVVHAAAPYADEVRAALLAHKERGALALSRPLGEALAKAVRAGLREAGLREAARPGPGGVPGAAHGHRGAVLLVPVPSARRAVRARGHDPALRIARAAAGVLRRQGVPVSVLPALRHRRDVADQSGLDARRRLANLAGALAVAPGCDRLLRGGSVVLVDDLMTTGASLAEAARAVRLAPCTEPRAGAVVGARGARMEVDLGSDASISSPPFVYGGETWERRGARGEGGARGKREEREEQRNGSVHERVDRGSRRSSLVAGTGRADRPIDVKCAAVVAASPGPFAINRN